MKKKRSVKRIIFIFCFFTSHCVRTLGFYYLQKGEGHSLNGNWKSVCVRDEHLGLSSKKNYFFENSSFILREDHYETPNCEGNIIGFVRHVGDLYTKKSVHQTCEKYYIALAYRESFFQVNDEHLRNALNLLGHCGIMNWPLARPVKLPLDSKKMIHLCTQERAKRVEYGMAMRSGGNIVFLSRHFQDSSRRREDVDIKRPYILQH